MKLKFFIFYLLILCNNLSGQNMQDYHWLFSNDTEATEGNESYGFDFNIGHEILSLQGIIPIEISGQNASISDENGNLLIYGNGCQLVGADHTVLPNGSNLNEGDLYYMQGDTTCWNGNIGYQNLMILPDPKTDNGFYQINKIILRENDSLHMEMRYSYIDLSLNSGLGDITEKNIKISQENKLFSHYLIANRHANGKDWWIVQATEKPDGFLTFLLNENGFSNPFLQTLDTSFHYNASASGSSAISPDGLHYAYFNPFDNLLFFEFNREDGTIHNLRKAKIFNGPESNASFSSIEFSSNSRFLYAAVGDSLWQVDLYENDLNDGIELIDVYDGTLDPFPTVFTQMALAPDCKIYIAPSSSTNSYHVINKPNEKGTSCDFVQRGIQLPFTSSTAGLPNFPKFRVDEDEKCDPTIGTMFGEVVFYRRDLTAFPNPSKGQVTIEIPEAINGQLYVFDMQGREVIQNIEINNRHEKQLDLTNLSSGSYTIEFIPLDTSEKLIWTNKIVIVK